MAHRPTNIAALALLVATPALAQPAGEYRVYDVSDLLPEEVRTIRPAGPASSSPGMQTTPKPVVLTQAEIAEQIARAMGIQADPIGPWLIGLLADPATHDAFSAVLDETNATYLETVAVRVAVYAIDNAESPTPGAAIQSDAWGPPTREISAVLRRRTPTRVASITTRGYAMDVNIITGTGGIGYEPQIGSVIEGLDLTVRVGVRDSRGRTRVEAVGLVSRVALRTLEMKSLLNTIVPESGRLGGGAVGPFELPTVDERPIRSIVSAGDGEEVVLAVADEPGAERRQVVTILLTPAR